MAFPFIIEFNEKLQIDHTKISEDELLLIIETYLAKNYATEIRKENNKIKFNSFHYKGTTSPLSGIDKGEFSLEKIDGDYNLKYKFYYIQMIILSTSFLIGISILSGHPEFGILGFVFLVIFGILLSISRQNTTYYKIIKLLNPNFQRPN
ncbi:MAG: hypothetical protein HY062_18430 [Bacteroidetes bacterium]|nr:hypothetical protein [Bacteroidota bacterium]